MGVIIVALSVKAADADAPAAVLVPAKGFHVAGFHCDDRGSYLAEHVMSKMRPFVAVTAGGAEIVIVAVFKSFFIYFCNKADNN